MCHLADEVPDMIGFRSQLMMIMERLMLARMQRKAVVLSVSKNLMEPGPV